MFNKMIIFFVDTRELLEVKIDYKLGGIYDFLVFLLGILGTYNKPRESFVSILFELVCCIENLTVFPYLQILSIWEKILRKIIAFGNIVFVDRS